MTIKELINKNFGISGPVAIRDIDILDEKEYVELTGIKDPKILPYLDWDIVQIYPTCVEKEKTKGLKKMFAIIRRKRKKEVEIDVEIKACLVITVVDHRINVVEEIEEDEETPKNFK